MNRRSVKRKLKDLIYNLKHRGDKIWAKVEASTAVGINLRILRKT